MSETAEHPLLTEQAEASKKTVKRRTTTAATKTATPKAVKSKKAAPVVEAAAPEPAPAAAEVQPKPKARARKASTPAAKVQESPAIPAPALKEESPAPAKPKAKASRKKVVEAVSDELPLDTTPSRKPAATVQQKKAAAAKVVSYGAEAEEWSPSKSRRAKAERHPAPDKREAAAQEKIPAPAAEAATPPASVQPEPAPTPAPSVAAVVSSDGSPIAAPPPPGRKYPVYIPRHIAKQMEAEGHTDPAAIVAAVTAAQSAPPQETHRRERERDREVPQRQSEPRPEPPPREEEIGSGEGIVEISGKGFGFIRDPKRSFAQHPADIFVTPELVKRYNLRDGQWVKGETRKGGRGSQLHKIVEINGEDPEKARTLPAFDELTVVNPLERINLETTPERYTTRIMDLMTPIGKGQRGLIVAPPRTGKTTLLQHIADAVVKNHPDVTLIMLLVDERPEEVTEIKRTVPTAELMASSNDMDVKSHTRIAQLAIERAKRMAESGKDVFILLDSITRVGRAFNNAMAGGGRTMSGGVDARALEIPRRLFAAARNTEEAGSITIIATALIDTGSRMDELIFQEFKGTGNMELVLDRKIADQRIYPAVDIFQSGTRREELLVPADDLQKIAVLRRGLAGHKPIEAIERLLFFARKFPTNTQMLREIPS